ncbi:MAG: hypothetical protein ACP5N7_05830 [Candidatus Pacearchaeota archaeon]
MKYTPVKTNFIYPDIQEKHYRFGSNQISALTLREDGNWEDYLPPYELQNRHGVESSACFIEAQQHAIAVLQEEIYDEKDNNYSARFNLNFSNATPSGGDPLLGAKSFANDGLIPDEMLPFSDDISTWEEFNSFKGANKEECIKKGQEWLTKWKPEYDIVFTRNERVEDKYKKLREALKYSPVPMSVLGWYQDENGLYVKPEGTNDNHMVVCIYLGDDNCPWIMDTYEPFIKRLAPFYPSDFAMRYTITKIIPEKTLFQKIVEWVYKQLSIIRYFIRAKK